MSRATEYVEKKIKDRVKNTGRASHRNVVGMIVDILHVPVNMLVLVMEWAS
jgi:hypothetical protein